ncbi:hypothetical protein [Streptomyces albus]|uniref:hypothetical protein n=1 Tax=Streptomyces sp. NRRL F-5917 TaxID=1463873 RepID=UPI0004C037EB|nr:hypothetical protein [Streptomyces sp. NRRL F-5917]
MPRKQEFADAVKELREFREKFEELGAAHERLERLDDPRVGLTALRGKITESRLEIENFVQTCVAGLQEKNCEADRRHQQALEELRTAREELRDLADALRAALPPEAGAPAGDEDPAGDGGAEHSAETRADDPAEPAEAEPAPAPAIEEHQHTEPGFGRRGESMEDSAQRPESGDEGGQDQHELKQAIEAAYRRAKAPSPAVSPAASPASQDGADTDTAESPQVTHGVVLLRAAGVAQAELLAHRDAWEWLIVQAARHRHFRTAPQVEELKGGRIRTVLSGRALIALLIELWKTRDSVPALDDGDWPLATLFYDRIADQLTDVAGQGETIRIVLDDGLPKPATDDNG